MTDGSTVTTENQNSNRTQQQILADYLLTGWSVLEVCSDYKAVLIIHNKTSEQKYVNFEQSGPAATAASSVQLGTDNFSQRSNTSFIVAESFNVSCQGNACTENNSTTFGDGVSDTKEVRDEGVREDAGSTAMDATSTAATQGGDSGKRSQNRGDSQNRSAQISGAISADIPKVSKSRSLIVEAGSQHHHKHRNHGVRTSSNNSGHQYQVQNHQNRQIHHSGHHNGHTNGHITGHNNGHSNGHNNGHINNQINGSNNQNHLNVHQNQQNGNNIHPNAHHIGHHNGHHNHQGHNGLHNGLNQHLSDMAKHEIRRISSPGLLSFHPVVRPNNRHSLDVPGPESVKEGQLVSEAVARLGEESLKKKEQARFDTNAAEEAERGSVVVQ